MLRSRLKGLSHVRIMRAGGHRGPPGVLQRTPPGPESCDGTSAPAVFLPQNATIGSLSAALRFLKPSGRFVR